MFRYSNKDRLLHIFHWSTVVSRLHPVATAWVHGFIAYIKCLGKAGVEMNTYIGQVTDGPNSSLMSDRRCIPLKLRFLP